mgnify:CR=1 FL=1|tara:strand:+ start:21323 stop:21730 length:408 start_codon:yes stop_codon:yes gene_type:complete
MQKRYLLLQEIEGILPQVEETLRKIQNLHKTIKLVNTVEIQVKSTNYKNLHYVTKFNKAFHRLSYEFYKNMYELESIGCFVKNLETGLVDFLSYFEGREIFFCWKLGETNVTHWHELDSGYTGRKKILDLEQWSK